VVTGRTAPQLALTSVRVAGITNSKEVKGLKCVSDGARSDLSEIWISERRALQRVLATDVHYQNLNPFVTSTFASQYVALLTVFDEQQKVCCTNPDV
jgi:hypothetical protein